MEHILFHMHTAPGHFQDKFNTLYPETIEVRSPDTDSLVAVANVDSVSCTYDGNKRSNKNFLYSDVLVMDLDNTHSDDPADWKTPEDIRQAFPGVPFAVSTSRNHLKAKDGTAPRPRYHVYFPVDLVTDYSVYRQLKEIMIARFPAFDGNAKDSGRLFYGTQDPQVAFFEVDADAEFD